MVEVMEDLKRLKYHASMLNRCINKAMRETDQMELIDELSKVNYHLLHLTKTLSRIVFLLMEEKRRDPFEH